MAQSNSFDILHTALQLPRDVVEKVVMLQRDKGLSVSQIVSAAVIQYVNNLPEETTHFCQGCNAFLPESDFYIQTSNAKPFKLCKTHHKDKNRQWYRENKAYVSQYKRQHQRLKKTMA